MNNRVGKNISLLKPLLVLLIVVLYWELFLWLRKYFEITPFPLLILPIVAFGWFWGIRKGIISGTVLVVCSMIIIEVSHVQGDNLHLGIIRLAVLLLLGSAAGWVRKLYEKEKMQSEMLAEEHSALLKEMEERKNAEKRALWDEHFMRVMTNSTPIGILAVNSNTDEILYCNHRFFEVFNIEGLEEKLHRGELKNMELNRYCVKRLKDPEAYYELFTPPLDMSSRKEINIELYFSDGRTVKHFSSEIRDENDEYLGRIFLFDDISESKLQEELLQKRFDYEHLLYEISSHFNSVSAENLNEAFNSSIKKITEFLGMDLGYFYQFDQEAALAVNLYEWRSGNINSEFMKILSVKIDSWTSFNRILGNFENIIVPDVEALSVDNSPEKEFMLKLGVKAVIISPVVSRNTLIGFLGFSAFTPKRLPYDADTVLKVMCDLFANALTRKQKNEALLASEERFRLLVQHSTDMIGILDANGYVTYVSPASKAITGKEPKEWLGKMFYPFIHPEDVVKFKETVRAFVKNPELPPVKLILRLPVEGGKIIFLETILNGQINNPAIRGIVCNSRDMSQHFALQEALYNSRNFLNAVINRAGDPMMVKDSRHRYTVVNEAYCRMLGRKKEELLGRTDFDLFPEEIAERFFQKDELILKNGNIENFEMEFFDNQGKKRFAVTNETLFQDESGEKYIIASMRDETKRKELEEEIKVALRKEKELSQMKSKFISMVSHEYRTPLTAILSSAELLELFGIEMSAHEKQEHLDKIKNSVDFLISMLNEVLLINRVESRRMDYSPVSFELIEYCSDLVKSLTDSLNCKIEMKSDFTSRTVVMDKKLLRHILINLLSNAVKYSNQGDTVRFNIFANGDSISFEVKDSGMGIPEEDQEKLFEPFFRANNVMHIAGSGLGLSIVKSCVELHNGNISFESKPSGGTSFHVSLPDELQKNQNI